jgi:hypothetical protein
VLGAYLLATMAANYEFSESAVLTLPDWTPLAHRPLVNPPNRQRRQLRRTALRHSRLTLADRLAYWQAGQWARGRTGLPWLLRLIQVLLAVIIVFAGLVFGAYLVV